jgi:hypothetical protein
MLIKKPLSKSFIHSINKILKNKCLDISHSLEVMESEISKNAGNGVFVSNGSITKNSVVCLYPGNYFPPPPVWAMVSVP